MLRTLDLMDAELRAQLVKWVPVGVVVMWMVLQPFHFSHYGIETQLAVLAYYFASTKLVLYLGLSLGPRKLEPTYQWLGQKSSRIRLFVLLLVFLVGVLIFLFKISFGFYPPNLERVATGIAATLGIGGLGLLLLRFPSHSRQVAVIEVNGHLFHRDELLYLESDKNYLRVFLWQNGAVQEHRIRARIKDVPCDQDLIQCHRGFIISISKVSQMYKEGQNASLRLEGVSQSIPVSRKKAPEIKNLLSVRPK